MEWKDQYKHQMWQKKRLEALSAAEFMCQRCCDSEGQLHVHHKHYVKGRKIWEYATKELSVLCEGCHAETHAEKYMLGEIFLSLDAMGYSDVVGLVASYCNEIVGPSRVDATDVIERLNDHHSFVIGLIAARIANRYLGVSYLNEIADAIKDAQDGSVVEIKIPVILRKNLDL